VRVISRICAATILHEVFLVALFRHRSTSLRVLWRTYQETCTPTCTVLHWAPHH